MENSLKEREKEIANRLKKGYFLIPETLNNAGFKDYRETNNVTARAKSNFIRFVKDFRVSVRYNLLVMGNPGTGKTHLCVAVARTLIEKGFTVGFLTTGKLLSIISETYQKGAAKKEEDIFRDLKKCDLLILDDLGLEAIGGNNDWRIAMMFKIVESRSGKPTIYTTNLTGTDLENAVGSRVYSRLNDNTKFIDLFTDDYRKNLQIK
ncbi:ATP-binding protein [Peribacillus sp. NJ4]|uniref:ATP-binding protein n=1 Tax=Peribacillus sp. NJ4 TaxID=3055862 RepID=UPI0025A2337B|nr:ATP-binding protein [Peribacillus sp. NJ4]MDM5210474.1 ATP-binding protein [Peribacillus sp. NJ4]